MAKYGMAAGWSAVGTKPSAAQLRMAFEDADEDQLGNADRLGETRASEQPLSLRSLPRARG
jgi:hypothetical protein